VVFYGFEDHDVNEARRKRECCADPWISSDIIRQVVLKSIDRENYQRQCFHFIGEDEKPNKSFVYFPRANASDSKHTTFVKPDQWHTDCYLPS
jgi:hypothetical protein